MSCWGEGGGVGAAAVAAVVELAGLVDLRPLDKGGGVGA